MSNPDPVLKECTAKSTGSRITVRANGRFATFLNPDKARVKTVDVDCWLRSSGTVKTDFIICKTGTVDVFVELKGKDIDHAIAQILATRTKWMALPECAAKLGALVVFTRSPKRSASLDTMKLKMWKRHKLWIEMDKCGSKDYEFAAFAGSKR